MTGTDFKTAIGQRLDGGFLARLRLHLHFMVIEALSSDRKRFFKKKFDLIFDDFGYTLKKSKELLIWWTRKLRSFEKKLTFSQGLQGSLNATFSSSANSSKQTLAMPKFTKIREKAKVHPLSSPFLLICIDDRWVHWRKEKEREQKKAFIKELVVLLRNCESCWRGPGVHQN